MKRFLSLIMILVMALSLCACHPSSPEPSPQPGGNDSEDLAQELYNTLSGVWVRQDSDAVSFLTISKDGGEVCYTAGIPMSDFIFGGPVDDVKKNGTVYSFIVHVPERQANELSDGWAAFDVSLNIDIARLKESSINAEDHAHDGKPADFYFYTEDWNNVDWGALYAGNEPMGNDAELLSSLWNQISGIWMYWGQYENFFTTFSISDGQYCVSQGIPASGFAMGGPVTSISRSNNVYELVIHIAGRHDIEMDYDDMDLTAKVTLNDDGTLWINLFTDDGDVVLFEYAAKDWDSFDWDAFYEKLGG
ncbi:MAG: hypothetical protein J5744_06420 [Oscillospiraceae bacterium]|nr:hypothetical protein [Oscillospiraceae bacterium]